MITLDGDSRSSEIFNVILNKMTESGLYSKLDKINVITVGNLSNLKTNFKQFDKIHHINHDDNVTNFEFPTLTQLYNDAINSDINNKLLYLHLKGSSKPKNKCDDDWLNKMLNCVVGQYEDCLIALDKCNTVGTMFSDSHIIDSKKIRHYPGNFWWANSFYVKKLPTPDWRILKNDFGFLIKNKINKNPMGPQNASYRYLAEAWIGFNNLDLECDNHGMKSID